MKAQEEMLRQQKAQAEKERMKLAEEKLRLECMQTCKQQFIS